MPEQQLVYENTWYLLTEPQLWTGHPHVVSDTSPIDSLFLCDFGEDPIPVFDYLSPNPSRVTVRVIVHDNPDFFRALAASDRRFLLLQFAHASTTMMQDGLSRFQYGFPVESLNPDCHGVLEYPHVEYYFTLITSNIDGEPLQRRHIINICSGVPPSKMRRILDRRDDLAKRVERRLAAEDPIEEDHDRRL